MLLAHKTQLKLNNKQRHYLNCCVGTSRFAYNWALNEWNKQYKDYEQAKRWGEPIMLIAEKSKNGKTVTSQAYEFLGVTYEQPDGRALKKQFNAYKKEHFGWIRNITKFAAECAFGHLQEAFNKFFNKSLSNGYPQYHKKGIHDSFTIGDKAAYEVDYVAKRVKLPKLGWVSVYEKPRFKGTRHSCTISKCAGKFYISVLYEVDNEDYIKQRNAKKKPQSVGIDVNMGDIVFSRPVLWNDELTYKISTPRAYRSNEKKLVRLQRKYSLQQDRSNRKAKTKLRIAVLHKRIADIRADFLNKLSTALTVTYGFVGIEDLNIKGMSGNHKLAKSVLDTGISKFFGQLEYKAKLYGSFIKKVDRFYPSSKTCFECGEKDDGTVFSKNLSDLSVRQWVCSKCNCLLDRDLNAAKNIEKEALRLMCA